jgi:hypothetical protein
MELHRAVKLDLRFKIMTLNNLGRQFLSGQTRRQKALSEEANRFFGEIWNLFGYVKAKQLREGAFENTPKIKPRKRAKTFDSSGHWIYVYSVS